MADTPENYSETAEALLLANLGFYDTKIPDALKTYLRSLLNQAYLQLLRTGIILAPGDLYDDQLQVMYAAWLYRNAGKGLAKPEMLVQEIRNRQVENALYGA